MACSPLRINACDLLGWQIISGLRLTREVSAVFNREPRVLAKKFLRACRPGQPIAASGARLKCSCQCGNQWLGVPIASNAWMLRLISLMTNGASFILIAIVSRQTSAGKTGIGLRLGPGMALDCCWSRG